MGCMECMNISKAEHSFLIFMTEFVQTCMIEMAVGKNSVGAVQLIPDNILMKQKLDMTMFEITLWSLDYNENHDGLRGDLLRSVPCVTV